jgi:hypothetical protein
MVLPDAVVIAQFGDPKPYLGIDGHILPAWPAKILTLLPLPAPIPLAGSPRVNVTHLSVHIRAAAAFSKALNSLYASGGWGLLKDTGGAYCWRTQRLAAHELSRHGWGIAVDLNTVDNPFMGSPKMDPRVVVAFKAAGFVWGGDFVHRPDGMHFELADLSVLTGSPA